MHKRPMPVRRPFVAACVVALTVFIVFGLSILAVVASPAPSAAAKSRAKSGTAYALMFAGSQSLSRYNGTLTLTAGKKGKLSGTLVTAIGTKLAVKGKTTGTNVNLSFSAKNAVSSKGKAAKPTTLQLKGTRTGSKIAGTTSDTAKTVTGTFNATSNDTPTATPDVCNDDTPGVTINPTHCPDDDPPTTTPDPCDEPDITACVDDDPPTATPDPCDNPNTTACVDDDPPTATPDPCEIPGVTPPTSCNDDDPTVTPEPTDGPGDDFTPTPHP